MKMKPTIVKAFLLTSILVPIAVNADILLQADTGMQCKDLEGTWVGSLTALSNTCQYSIKSDLHVWSDNSSFEAKTWTHRQKGGWPCPGDKYEDLDGYVCKPSGNGLLVKIKNHAINAGGTITSAKKIDMNATVEGVEAHLTLTKQ